MSDQSDEQEIISRRAPRRRAASSRGEREPREPRVARRSTTRRSLAARREVPSPEPEISTEAVIESRKAPTPLAAEKEERSDKRRQLYVVGAVLLVGIAASAAVGFVDQGQINVQQTIEARNERIRNNQAEEGDTLVSKVEIPVQNTDSAGKVDGGFLGRGTGGRKSEPIVETVASTSATSTAEVASSTESVASSTVESSTESASTEELSQEASVSEAATEQ